MSKSFCLAVFAVIAVSVSADANDRKGDFSVRYGGADGENDPDRDPTLGTYRGYVERGRYESVWNGSEAVLQFVKKDTILDKDLSVDLPALGMIVDSEEFTYDSTNKIFQHSVYFTPSNGGAGTGFVSASYREWKTSALP